MTATEKIKQALSSLQNADSFADKRNAVNEITNGVRSFVSHIKEAEELAHSLPQLAKEIRDMEDEIKNEESPGIKRQLDRELQDKKKLHSDAVQANRKLDNNKQILRQLQADVANLNSELRKAA